MTAQSSTGLRLRILGKFALMSGEKEVVMSGVKPRALLAFLACNAGKPQSRDKLIGLLWGERFEEQARQSLRHALSALRKTLGSELLDADRDQVRLSAAFGSDVAQFHALIAAGDRDSLSEAADLYEDELLSGFVLHEGPFADWLAAERVRLREAAIGALEIPAEDAADTAPDKAIGFSRRILALDPYRERAHRQLLAALATAGRRNEALLHYRQIERQLQEELGVAPEAETRAVFASLQSGAPARPAGEELIATPSAADKPAIAVLPFEALGEDAATARLATGVTEDIISALTHLCCCRLRWQNHLFPEG